VERKQNDAIKKVTFTKIKKAQIKQRENYHARVLLSEGDFSFSQFILLPVVLRLF
jgi:hypothetical protein